MKQEEKNKLSYNKILNAAIIEFGKKGYDGASLNTICTNNHISKGLIYHYFKNKDDLYLKCVECCFRQMNKDIFDDESLDEIKKVISKRQDFFNKHEEYSNIFFQTVLTPPKHLIDEIKVIRKEFDQHQIFCYKKLLHNVQLKDGINEDQAIEYLFVFQEMFNGYFQNKITDKNDFTNIIASHENKLGDFINVILYGLVKQ